MFQNSGSFINFFQGALFSFADLRGNKGFLMAECPCFSLSQQKKKIYQSHFLKQLSVAEVVDGVFINLSRINSRRFQGM